MSSLELLPFQGPSLSFVAHCITILFVLIVLLVFRQLQESRKRRRVAVWVFDVGRVLISYIAAHILLHIFIPFIGVASTKTNNTTILLEPSTVAEFGKLNDQGAAIASQQLDMLTFTALDIFPGIPLLYVLYTSVLHGAYHARNFWVTTLARVRLRRDVSSSCLYSIYTLPPPGRDHVDPELADMPGTSIPHPSPADTGFVSGNYGAPVRVRWLVQQTALLALSIFTLRAALFYIVTGSGTSSIGASALVQGVRSILFSWLVDTKNPGHGDYIMHAIILPSILYSTRFALADYLLRYRLSKTSANFDTSMMLPLYSDRNYVEENARYRDVLPPQPFSVEQQHVNVDSSLQFTPALLPQAVASKKTIVVRRTFSPIHFSQPVIDPAPESALERAPERTSEPASKPTLEAAPESAPESASKAASEAVPELAPELIQEHTTELIPELSPEPVIQSTSFPVFASSELSISETSTLVTPTPIENNIEENIEAFVDDIYGLGKHAFTKVKQLPESSEELKQAIESVKMTVDKVEFQQKFNAVRKTVEGAEITQKFDAVKKAMTESAEFNQALDSVKKTVEAVDFSQVRENLSLASSRIKPLLFSSATNIGLGLSGVGVGSSVGHIGGSPLMENGGFQMPGLYGIGSRLGGLSPRVQTPTTPSASFTPVSTLNYVMSEKSDALDLGIDEIDAEEKEEELLDDDEEQQSSDEDVD